jgi:hypothetical protein
VSVVASSLTTVSVRDMVEALIRGGVRWSV